MGLYLKIGEKGVGRIKVLFKMGEISSYDENNPGQGDKWYGRKQNCYNSVLSTRDQMGSSSQMEGLVTKVYLVTSRKSMGTGTGG